MLDGYEFINTLSESHKDQLLELYNNEWWSKDRKREDIEKILQGSSFIVGIINKSNTDLVAFARILTDYFKYAYIYDVIVKENHRNFGLGHVLLEAVIQHPKLKDLKCIELSCLEEMKPFYEKYGFSDKYEISIPMRKVNHESKIS